MWQEFVDAAGGMCADAVEYVTQVSPRFNVMIFTGGDQAVQDSRPVAAVVTAGKHPVFSADGHPAQFTFRKIIVYVKNAVFQIAVQSFPIG